MNDAPSARHRMPQGSTHPPLCVGVREACRLTGIGRSKLYMMIKSGEVRTVKIGTCTLIPMTSLESILGKGPDPVTSPDR